MLESAIKNCTAYVGTYCEILLSMLKMSENPSLYEEHIEKLLYTCWKALENSTACVGTQKISLYCICLKALVNVTEDTVQ
jgi:hypothetical protein